MHQLVTETSPGRGSNARMVEEKPLVPLPHEQLLVVTAWGLSEHVTEKKEIYGVA